MVTSRPTVHPPGYIYEFGEPRGNDTDTVKLKKKLGAKPAPVSLCPRQVPHGHYECWCDISHRTSVQARSSCCDSVFGHRAVKEWRFISRRRLCMTVCVCVCE
jgi:hypothetical protein